MPDIRRAPWYSMEEWKKVKKCIISPDCKDWIRAYQLMLMWKMRCPKLPASVECSLSIMQVLVMKASVKNSIENDILFSDENDLQLAFSTAVVRFVNHIMIPSQNTFYGAALEQNIPDWVVNLRHDVSHSAALPDLQLLEDAVDLAKKWLIENYWDPQEEEMSDVNGTALSNDKVAGVASMIENSLKCCLTCWFICRSKLIRDKYATVKDLTDHEWKNLVGLKKMSESSGLIKGSKSFLRLMDSYPSKKKNKDTLKRLFKALNLFLSSIRKKKNVVNIFVSHVFELGLLNSGGKDLELWTPVLEILYELDSMESFLDALFGKIASGTEGTQKAANDWLLVLLPSIEVAKRRWTARKHGNEIIYDTQNENDLQLPLRKPPRLCYETFRKVLINLNPEWNSCHVISRYGKFLQPKIGKETRSTISKLIKLYTNDACLPDTELEDLSMYSVEDLPAIPSTRDQIVPDNDQDSIWTEVEIDVEEWHRCPIGLLPHQKEVNLELPDLVWKEVTQESRKRKATEDIF